MNRLLTRCSAFWTASVMPCSMLPQEQQVPQHDLRSYKLHVAPNCRFVERGFLNLEVIQSRNRLVAAFLCELFLLKSSIIVGLFGDFKTCFIKLEMRKTFACLLFRVLGSSDWSDMRIPLPSPRVASSLVKVESFLLEQNFTCKSDNLVQCACKHAVVQNNCVTATMTKTNLAS